MRKNLTVSDIIEGYKENTASVNNLYEDFKNKEKGDIFSALCPEITEKQITYGDKNSIFYGIPFGISDNFCTENILTSAQSKMLENFVPCYSSDFYKKLLNIGFIPFGKTVIPEFSKGDILTKNGKTHVWGNVEAVARGLLPLTFGYDCDCSALDFSSEKDVFSFYPDKDLFSNDGIISYSPSFDRLFYTANSISDLKLIFDNVFKKSEKAKKNSYYITYFPDILNNFGIKDDKIIKEYENKIIYLKSLGFKLISEDFSSLKYAYSAYTIISSCEASSSLGRYDGVRFGYRTNKNCSSFNELFSESRTNGFGHCIKSRILLGIYALSPENYKKLYLPALKAKCRICEDFQRFLNNSDFVLIPSLSSDLKYYGNYPFKENILDLLFAVSGLPCLNLPKTKGICNFNICCKNGESSKLLDFALNYEKAIFGKVE